MSAAENDRDDQSVATSSSACDTFVSQFVDMAGHQYFCEVIEEFIEDEFNLTGLSALVPRYKEALELVLDLEPERPIVLAEVPAVQESADLLYGLIHARYIIMRQGLQAMAQKYECHDFGTCPRYLCHNMGLLPIGRHDLPGYETVKLYCPCCRDIYAPSNSRFLNIDGAFFGSSFAGMFLEMYKEIEADCVPLRQRQFQLKVFGFRISEHSHTGPRMKWLRQTPESLQIEIEDRQKELEREESEQLEDSMDL